MWVCVCGRERQREKGNEDFNWLAVSSILSFILGTKKNVKKNWNHVTYPQLGLELLLHAG